MGLKSTLHDIAGHVLARWRKTYYFEDYLRVYPEGEVFDRFGRRKGATKNHDHVYENHVKSYRFAAQFVEGKSVVDVGCGSGYGCKLLHDSGAARVSGVDLSEHALAYAREHYGEHVEFTRQQITAMEDYADDTFDISVSCEVLEHVKEYGVEELQVREMKRITRPGGLIVIATPNSELCGDHGFTYDEMNALFARNFTDFCLFENSLVPVGAWKQAWERRVAEGKLGVLVSQDVDLTDIYWDEDEPPELKTGLEPGTYAFGALEVDTTLLHNTHGWIVLAVNPA